MARPRVALIAFLSNNLSIRALSSYLKEQGCDVLCFFCEGSWNERNLHELIEILRREEIILAGVSFVTDDYRSAVQVTEEIRKKLTIPVIWGGAHVNVMPEESLRHADMICLGEGEEALLELVQGLSGGRLDTGIQNIWFHSDKVSTRNIIGIWKKTVKVSLPGSGPIQPVRDGRNDFEKLTKHSGTEYSVMTSRGCPYNCNYCYNSYRKKQYAGKGRYLRSRSISHVIDELCRAQEVYPHLKKINFWDDSFIARGIKEIEEFAKLYEERIGLPFFALAEPMAFNKEKLRILRKCGLNGLQVGIQTGSERTNRDIYNRTVTKGQLVDMAEFINELGIEPVYDVIFNNPYESPEDVKETIDLLLQFPSPFFLQGYNLIFYPGTAIAQRALTDGYISSRGDGEEFSSILGRENSPVAMRGNARISSRFYTIAYDIKGKMYMNSVLSLLAYRLVPKPVVRFFGRSETALKRVMLAVFIKAYASASAIRHRWFSRN